MKGVTHFDLTSDDHSEEFVFTAQTRLEKLKQSRLRVEISGGGTTVDYETHAKVFDDLGTAEFVGDGDEALLLREGLGQERNRLRDFVALLLNTMQTFSVQRGEKLRNKTTNNKSENKKEETLETFAACVMDERMAARTFSLRHAASLPFHSSPISSSILRTVSKFGTTSATCRGRFG